MKKFKKVLLGIGVIGALAISTACSGQTASNETKAQAGGTEAQAGNEAGEKSAVKTMAGADLQAIEDDKEKKEGVMVVDVRSPEEYAEGHVKFAINMPIDTFKDNISKLDAWKDKSVILYCNSGKKSGEAADILVENGFKDVTNADGVKQYEYKLVKYGNITGEELMAKKDEAFIVDAREAKDYDKEHFANPINVNVEDLSTLDSRLPEDKDTLIITHCYSGNRSAKAAAYIADKGYTNVWNTLDGTKEMEYKFN